MDERANLWQMNFNVDKCSIKHIGHNNIHRNCSEINQLLPTIARITVKSRSYLRRRLQIAETNREKLQNCQQSVGVH